MSRRRGSHVRVVARSQWQRAAGRFAAAFGALLAVLVLPLACQREAGFDGATPARAGRFGSLRDLVLFVRPGARPTEALFCDRFEATRGDWAEFAATAAGAACDAGRVPVAGDPSVAVGFVDLRQARAFARWRFLRLPRRDEWLHVALDGGRSRFPWGDRVDPSRANTAELGLWQATPVGTFESGRQAGGGNPYDLIGNVSEWTESPASWWCDSRQYAGSQPLDPLGGLSRARADVAATPALAAWSGPGGLAPASWLVAAVAAHVPRECAGSDFASSMEETADYALPEERSPRRGVRLLTTAGELLAALAAEPSSPSPVEALQLRRFLARDAHGEALAAAWRELAARGAAPGRGTPMGALLAAELGVADAPAERR